MTSDVYSKKSYSFSSLIRLVDSFYMKFLVVLILLIMPVGLVETQVFGVEKLSKASLFIFIVASTLVTLLWIKLDLKATPNLFSGYVPGYIKKNALIKRGVLLFIMKKLLADIDHVSISSVGFLKFIFFNISRLYLSVGIIVILVAAILILFRPTRRKLTTTKRKNVRKGLN